MKNPIQKTDLFMTPDSLGTLMKIADSMTNSFEAYRMMVFTLNYCHDLIEKEFAANISEETK